MHNIREPELAALRASYQRLYDSFDKVRSMVQTGDTINPDSLSGPLVVVGDSINTPEGIQAVRKWHQLFMPAFDGIDLFKKQVDAGIEFNSSDWKMSIDSITIALNSLTKNIIRIKRVAA